jgi:hypothetical protein
MHKAKPIGLVLILITVFLFGVPTVQSADLNELSNAEKQVEWRLLFDGKSLNGWIARNPGSWVVENGEIVCKDRGDLFSKERFGNFFFQCDFKMGPGCNSGIYVRVGDKADRSNTGFEIQILDPARTNGPASGRTGAVYNRMPPLVDAAKPAGEWNHILIMCLNNIVKIRLNDQLVIDMDVNDWSIPLVNPDGSWNKYLIPLKDYPREGHLGFQSHSNDTGGNLWLRNIKVVKIPVND